MLRRLAYRLVPALALWPALAGAAAPWEGAVEQLRKHCIAGACLGMTLAELADAGVLVEKSPFPDPELSEVARIGDVDCAATAGARYEFTNAEGAVLNIVLRNFPGEGELRERARVTAIQIDAEGFDLGEAERDAIFRSLARRYGWPVRKRQDGWQAFTATAWGGMSLASSQRHNRITLSGHARRTRGWLRCDARG